MEIACNLTGTEVDAQLAAWAGFGPALRRSTPIDGGVRLWFDGGVEPRLRQVAAVEARCCPFLSLAVAVDGDTVRLDVTAEQAEGRPVIEALARSIGAPTP